MFRYLTYSKGSVNVESTLIFRKKKLESLAEEKDDGSESLKEKMKKVIKKTLEESKETLFKNAEIPTIVETKEAGEVT